jgi:hypothetical protein
MSTPKLGCILLVMAMVAWANAQDQEEINRAVDRGIDKIKSEGPKWTQDEGGVAICAWTLLESGVSPKDKELQMQLAEVRKRVFDLKNTYGLAATIFLLDKLGDPADRPLIQALASQLCGGFFAPLAAWGYVNPEMSEEERKKLPERMKAAGDNPPAKDAKPELDAEGKKLLNALTRRGDAMGNVGGYNNSTTQFAVMALWVGRRHGVPVDHIIRRVDERYRKHSHPKGGWGYNIYNLEPERHDDPTGAMTCAGLLAMALGNGIKKEPNKDLVKDPFVKKTFDKLTEYMDEADKKKKDFFARPPDYAGTKNFYFLWSLERVGVLYEFKDGKLGGRDWYKWGADLLINTYPDPGKWEGGYQTADTCFAVLFLKKANVAADLTKQMQLFNPIQKKEK